MQAAAELGSRGGAHMGQAQTAWPALDEQLISQPPLFMAPLTPPSHMFCGTHADDWLWPPIWAPNACLRHQLGLGASAGPTYGCVGMGGTSAGAPSAELPRCSADDAVCTLGCPLGSFRQETPTCRRAAHHEEAKAAGALVAAVCVGAVAPVTAGRAQRALVDILAGLAVSLKACDTGARWRARRVWPPERVRNHVCSTSSSGSSPEPCLHG